MNSQVVIQATVTADGSLHLSEKVPLPAGQVQVTIVPVPNLPADDPFWQRMQAIWKGQQERGHVARSVEEVEAERRAMREQWDERMRRIEQIQAEAERARAPRSQGS